MLHKTKHGAYLELVGRPKSWCKPAVASVKWSTTKLCEWKVTRSLSRTALPPHKGWELHWVSFPRQFSEAGLGSGPSSGGACRRWVRSLRTWPRPTVVGRVCAGLLPSGARPAPPAGRPACCWSGEESVLCRARIRGVIAARGISCCQPSTGAILKCHLSDLAKGQMQAGVEFAINSNRMLRFAPNSSPYLKTGRALVT